MVLLGRGAALAIAYVPGRVLGIGETWPARMLVWRKVFGPIASALAVIVVALQARRPRAGGDGLLPRDG